MNNIDENFNVCEIGSIIKKIKGLSSNSASPTDTWIIYFDDDITYDNKSITSGFLKIFIDPLDSLPPTTIANLGLKYEMDIYKYIINDIIKYKICPNFVKYLASGEKCSFNDLLNILHDNLYDPLGITLLPSDECYKNLIRNLFFILKQKENRPSIQSNVAIHILIRPVNFDIKSYNILLLENMEDKMTLNRWMQANSRNYLEFWNVLFQIAVACHVMSLSKLVHNDLHSGNIFIKDLGVETTFVYNINGNEIVIKTRYQPLIYDFDRGYAEKFGNNELLDNCTKFSQCNIFIQNKDIVKILCYVYKYVDNTIKDEILELISNTSEYRDRIKNTYELKSAKEDGLKYCFLQYIDDLDNKEKAIPIEWYSNFNDNIDILLNIKNNHLPVYSSDLVDINNIFTYNTDYFKPNGELNMRKIITNGDEETKEGEIEILEEIDPDNLFDLELGSDELRKLSELLKDDDEYKFPTPLSIRSNKSSLNSTSGTELYKRMKELSEYNERQAKREIIFEKKKEERKKKH